MPAPLWKLLVAGGLTAMALAATFATAAASEDLGSPLRATGPTAVRVAHVPVLGQKPASQSGAVGWGTYKPRMIFNGGDPSGRVEAIHWHHWGDRVALGFGRTYIFRPTGGYYGRMVEAELRPADLGRCTRHGPLAYRQMDAREPSKPGGPLGKWFRWAGWPSLCLANGP
jgi:hypothetical protein